MSKTTKIAVLILSLGWLVFVVAAFSSADNDRQSCKGAQKRVDDTFKVMDACQKLIGCTITVDDLRVAQEQLNRAQVCK